MRTSCPRLRYWLLRTVPLLLVERTEVCVTASMHAEESKHCSQFVEPGEADLRGAERHAGSAVGKARMRKCAEIVERSFAHTLERGGMWRTWLRGRENVHKRYLIHVAGHNLGLLMRF